MGDEAAYKAPGKERARRAGDGILAGTHAGRIDVGVWALRPV